MNQNTQLGLNLGSGRARKARLSVAIGSGGYRLLCVLTVVFAAVAAYCFTFGDLPRLGYLAAAVALLTTMLTLWYHYDLSKVPVQTPPKSLDDVLSANLLAHLPHKDLTPKQAWEAAMHDWPAHFICDHLYIQPKSIAAALTDNAADMAMVWQQALALQQHAGGRELHGGTLAVSLIVCSPAMQEALAKLKLKPQDLVEVHAWVQRQIDFIHQPKPNFGGIGRDWASGFTPTLDRFSSNISRAIEANGGYGRFVAHADVLDGIMSNLSQGMGVAVVGPAGVGKSALIYALGERLLKGNDPSLRYYQIVSLSASQIMSAAGSQLETLMLHLFSEANAAGNIILFLDEAQLFFNSGVGAFDMSQLLLPVMKNRRVKIIAALTPGDWQRLRATQSSLTGSFAPVVLNEPSPQDTLKVLEDGALMVEHQNRLLVTYDGVQEAYRLSGQYMQEDAYPGKAITLLEQAAPYAQHGAITAETVQAALEKMRGVRVSTAAAPEADMLLHLEDRIHERMINQVQAVNVIAAALRRGRAGVANPKRPVGSFLFLGPTGVGKTELAKSLAAVYFGDEHQMIRLDMSEYQRPEDVSRLLAGSGGQGSGGLLTAVRQQPFAVVLLDEVEKAHPNILNLLLQMLDEGQLTDEAGRPASFRSAIIIATSNAGATDIITRVRAGGGLDDSFERPLLDKLIQSGQFKPELINRFDEVVLFRPLGEQELMQVAQLMLGEVNRTLANQNVSVQLTPAALQMIVHQGYDPEFGARPMRRVIQKTVENAVAVKLLGGQAAPGSVINLDVADLAPASP